MCIRAFRASTAAPATVSGEVSPIHHCPGGGGKVGRPAEFALRSVSRETCHHATTKPDGVFWCRDARSDAPPSVPPSLKGRDRGWTRQVAHRQRRNCSSAFHAVEDRKCRRMAQDRALFCTTRCPCVAYRMA